MNNIGACFSSMNEWDKDARKSPNQACDKGRLSYLAKVEKWTFLLQIHFQAVSNKNHGPWCKKKSLVIVWEEFPKFWKWGSKEKKRKLNDQKKTTFRTAVHLSVFVRLLFIILYEELLELILLNKMDIFSWYYSILLTLPNLYLPVPNQFCFWWLSTFMPKCCYSTKILCWAFL